MKQQRNLAERLKRKDESALEKIMEQYTRLITSVIYNIGKGSLSTEDMEEVAMDTFITLWNNTDKIREDTLQGYLCCIAKTKTFDKLDKVKKTTTVNIESADIEDPFSLELDTENRLIGEDISKIIEEISFPDKEVVLRYYFYHQTTADISEKMNINRQTVKTKLAKARKTIKNKLKERGYDL